MGCGTQIEDFHGDFARKNNFWVYTDAKNIGNKKWDCLSEESGGPGAFGFCTNSVQVFEGAESPKEGKQQWVCLGHGVKH